MYAEALGNLVWSESAGCYECDAKAFADTELPPENLGGLSLSEGALAQGAMAMPGFTGGLFKSAPQGPATPGPQGVWAAGEAPSSQLLRLGSSVSSSSEETHPEEDTPSEGNTAVMTAQTQSSLQPESVLRKEVDGLRSSLYSLEDRLGDKFDELMASLAKPRRSGFPGQA